MPSRDTTIAPRAEARAPRHGGSARGRRALLLASLLVAFGVAARLLAVGTYHVPSESMLPTLLVGDFILVDKLAYGARLPGPRVMLPWSREPARGDVVAFLLGRSDDGDLCPLDRCPRAPRERFVKRIAGVPGDEVAVAGGTVRLNGEALPREATDETVVDRAGEVLRVARERLGGASHPVADHPDREGMDQVRITVPEGRYFLLGDNRDASGDSRSFGTVRRGDLLGRVVVRYWSWSHEHGWLDMLHPGTWISLLGSETRWDRIGTRVE